VLMVPVSDCGADGACGAADTADGADAHGHRVTSPTRPSAASISTSSPGRYSHFSGPTGRGWPPRSSRCGASPGRPASA